MSCTFSSCKFRATLHSSSRLPLHSHPLHSHHMAQHKHKFKKNRLRYIHIRYIHIIWHNIHTKSIADHVAPLRMQTPSKKRKCSNNGGTTAETSANNNAANLQPPNNHDHHSPASVARFPPVDDNPSFDADELNEKFCAEFPKGRWFNSREEAFDEVIGKVMFCIVKVM